jgi:hypothetical protein
MATGQVVTTLRLVAADGVAGDADVGGMASPVVATSVMMIGVKPERRGEPRDDAIVWLADGDALTWQASCGRPTTHRWARASG